MKQTAVEWLVEQLARKNNEFQALTFYYDHKEEIEQAKEMEKEQIIDAYDEGYGTRDAFGDVTENNTGEQYYTETYKSNT